MLGLSWMVEPVGISVDTNQNMSLKVCLSYLLICLLWVPRSGMLRDHSLKRTCMLRSLRCLQPAQE